MLLRLTDSRPKAPLGSALFTDTREDQVEAKCTSRWQGRLPRSYVGTRPLWNSSTDRRTAWPATDLRPENWPCVRSRNFLSQLNQVSGSRPCRIDCDAAPAAGDRRRLALHCARQPNPVHVRKELQRTAEGRVAERDSITIARARESAACRGAGGLQRLPPHTGGLPHAAIPRGQLRTRPLSASNECGLTAF